MLILRQDIYFNHLQIGGSLFSLEEEDNLERITSTYRTFFITADMDSLKFYEKHVYWEQIEIYTWLTSYFKQKIHFLLVFHWNYTTKCRRQL